MLVRNGLERMHLLLSRTARESCSRDTIEELRPAHSVRPIACPYRWYSKPRNVGSMPEVHTRHKRHFLVSGELGEEMLDIKAIAGAVRSVTHI